jgi:hypothetical protein
VFALECADGDDGGKRLKSRGPRSPRALIIVGQISSASSQRQSASSIINKRDNKIDSRVFNLCQAIIGLSLVNHLRYPGAKESQVIT